MPLCHLLIGREIRPDLGCPRGIGCRTANGFLQRLVPVCQTALGAIEVSLPPNLLDENADACDFKSFKIIDTQIQPFSMQLLQLLLIVFFQIVYQQLLD